MFSDGFYFPPIDYKLLYVKNSLPYDSCIPNICLYLGPNTTRKSRTYPPFEVALQGRHWVRCRY